MFTLVYAITARAAPNAMLGGFARLEQRREIPALNAYAKAAVTHLAHREQPSGSW